jgi:predicted transposase YbfD/YdcC
LDEVENYFTQAAEVGPDYASLNEYTTEEQGHGRMELRRVYTTDDIDWLPQKDEWKGLKTIIKLESVRWSEGKKQQEIRYYISSLPSEAERIGKAIRGHWSVENKCHWVLDVVFAEDQSLITQGTAPENLRVVNLLAAKMLKEEKSCKKGIRAKQFKAALDNGYLHKVLLASSF